MTNEDRDSECKSPMVKNKSYYLVFQKKADLENLIFRVILKCILRNRVAKNFVTDLAKCLLVF